uniref:ZP domain-containing protein n=1 Tax=Neogobius melanostomus TaxID=47308 RepID=A0A8C6UW02_9GOBI
MWSCLGRILLFCSYFHCSFQTGWDFKKKPEDEWNRLATMKAVPGAMPKLLRTMSSESDFLWLPEFVKASSAVDQKTLFVPEMGARPLPDSVQPILFPTTTTPVSTEPQSGLDALTVKNTLHYQPTTVVLRDMPFDISVQCNYHRYIHSYKVGIRPKLQGGVLLKSLRMKHPFIIIPQDALGHEMTTPYSMGDTMFFEVKQPDGTASSANERIYINKCFITSSFFPSSTQNAVIDNYGCMVDGLESENSKFLSGPSMTTQRFSISAGVLLEMASTHQVHSNSTCTVKSLWENTLQV